MAEEVNWKGEMAGLEKETRWKRAKTLNDVQSLVMLTFNCLELISSNPIYFFFLTSKSNPVNQFNLNLNNVVYRLFVQSPIFMAAVVRMFFYTLF